MKFTLVKNLKSDQLMRPVLVGLLLFLTLYFISDLFIMIDFYGASWQEIQNTFYGNEEEYIEALTFGAILEIVHKTLFFMMISLLLVVIVFARVHRQTVLSKMFIHSIMITALLSLITFVLAYYFGSLFLLLWLVMTVLWHIMALSMSISSIFKLS